MRWTEHVAHMGKMRNATALHFENYKGKDYLGNLDIDRREILI